MEILDVYDRDRRLTGGKMVRGSGFIKDAYHLVIHVCLFNTKGEMLIQKRKKNKHGWPGRWDLTCAGCVKSGETSREAAQRELMEEMGVSVDMSEARALMTVNFDTGYDDYFSVIRDVAVSDLALQREEVDEAAYATEDEIRKMIADGRFIPYHQSFISLIFDMRKNGLLYNKRA